MLTDSTATKRKCETERVTTTPTRVTTTPTRETTPPTRETTPTRVTTVSQEKKKEKKIAELENR